MFRFKKELQVKVEILDPSISHYLRVEEVTIDSLVHWLRPIDFKMVEIILVPYNEE